MVLEIEIKGDIKDKQEESYRFFNVIDWTEMKELKDVQEKYDLPDDIRARNKGMNSIL